VHIYFKVRETSEGYEHEIVLKTTDYKHTILHGEGGIKEAQLHAIDMALKLGLVSSEDAKEATSKVG
jgi:hypothetical protein